MRLALLTLFVFMVPAGALAATGGDHGPLTLESLLGSRDFWGAVVNSTLLFGILYFATRKKIAKSLEERRASVQDQLKEAKRLREAAEKRHAEYESRLAQLDAELASLRASIVHSGQVESDRLIKEAEAKAARMREDASRLIENRVKQLEKDLHREVVIAAVAAAQQELVKKTSADDQSRLATDYLKTVESAGADLGKESHS